MLIGKSLHANKTIFQPKTNVKYNKYNTKFFFEKSRIEQKVSPEIPARTIENLLFVCLHCDRWCIICYLCSLKITS